MKLATVAGTEVARPIKVLVPLIAAELEAGDSAGIEHYKRAGEMLIEAKEQMLPGEFDGWTKRNFNIGRVQAARYMKLATASDVRRRTFTTLSAFTEPNRTHHQPHWQQPVQDILSRVDVDALARDQLSRVQEAAALHKLGHQLIDAGYKALASKLHPDRKGGSSEGMARLNKVRAVLKGAI